MQSPIKSNDIIKEFDNKQTKLSTAQQNAVDSGITSTKVGNYDSHLSNTSNPHSVTKAQVGLGNCDNTSDANKPISTATQTALDGKQATIDSSHKLSADLVDDSSATNKFVTASDKTTWNSKQNALSTAQMNAVNSGVTSTKVGNYDTHIADSTIHVTSTDKTNWDGKVTANTAITGATKCKITYDAKGLVTAGANLQASDIPNLTTGKVTALTGYTKASSAAEIVDTDSLNTALGKIQKTLDGKQASGSYVPTSRTVNGKALSSNITLSASDVSALPSSTVVPTKSDIVDMIYPVGAIYISVVNTSPATLFGGTWASIGAGRTLVGVDANDTDYNTVEKTGGSKTKTLVKNNIPSHDHTATTTGTFASHSHGKGTFRITGGAYFRAKAIDTSGKIGCIQARDSVLTTTQPYIQTASSHLADGYLDIDTNYGGWSGSSESVGGNITATTTIGATGSGTAFDVKNPYLTVYMWKRTA